MSMVRETYPKLPIYVCHKEVQAARIIEIQRVGAGYALTLEGVGPVITVTKEWYDKHNPHPWGYYVVYKDGYASYSPPRAFEEGYTLKE